MDPVFQSLAELKSALRASGIRDCSDAGPVLDKCIGSARLQLKRALSLPRMNALAALTPPDPPVTEQDYHYFGLRLAEQKLVECCLTVSLAVALRDGGAGMQEWFDQESPFRSMNYYDAQERCRTLAFEADQLLEESGGSAISGQGSYDFGAACPPPPLGLSYDRDDIG